MGILDIIGKDAAEAFITKYGSKEAAETVASDLLSSGGNTAEKGAFNGPSFKVGDTPVSSEDFGQVAQAQSIPQTPVPQQVFPNIESGVLSPKTPNMTPVKEELPQYGSHLDNLPSQDPSNNMFADTLQTAKEHAGDIAAGGATLGTGAALMPRSEDLSTSDRQSPESVRYMNSLGLGQYNDPEFYNGDNKQLAVPPMAPHKASQELEEPEEEDDEPGKKTMPAKKATGALETPSQKESLPNSSKLMQLLATDKGQQTYQDMLKNRDLSVLGNQLGQAGNIIGSAIARVPVNEAAGKLFASNVANAEQMPKDFQQASAMEEQDPNSAVSKNYREFLKNQGLDVGPGVTAQQVKDVLLPAVEKEKLQAERLQGAKDTKQLQMQYMQLKQKELQQNKDISRQDKQDKEDRSENDKIMKETNAMTASSRSVVGAAAMAKRRAQNLKDIVTAADATPQDMALAANELNTIVTNTSTVMGAKHQEYNNLMTDLAKGMSYITSAPQAPDVPQVKKHMSDIADRMIKLSDNTINSNFKFVKSGHQDYSKRHPEVIDNMADALAEQLGTNTPAVPGTNPEKPATQDGFTPMTKDGINFKPIPNARVEEAKAHGYR